MLHVLYPHASLPPPGHGVWIHLWTLPVFLGFYFFLPHFFYWTVGSCPLCGHSFTFLDNWMLYPVEVFVILHQLKTLRLTTKTFLQILLLVWQQQKPFLSFGRGTTKTLPLDPKIITQRCGCALSVRVVLFCILTHLGLFCFPSDGL